MRAGGVRTGIARAATLLILLMAVSQVLGFVRDAVIAAVFGAGAALDAYLVAQSVMKLPLQGGYSGQRERGGAVVS